MKARSKEMASLSKAIALKRNKCWLTWTGKIFIDEQGKNSTMVGRNFAYKPVIVNGGNNLFGKYMMVNIREATPMYLVGELIAR